MGGRGREVGEMGEGSGGERGRELGMWYPPVHPLFNGNRFPCYLKQFGET